MAKTAMRKHRDRIVIAALVAGDQIADQRKLANIEFFVAQHSPMALRRSHGQDVQIDSLGLDFTVDQRP